MIALLPRNNWQNAFVKINQSAVSPFWSSSGFMTHGMCLAWRSWFLLTNIHYPFNIKSEVLFIRKSEPIIEKKNFEKNCFRWMTLKITRIKTWKYSWSKTWNLQMFLNISLLLRFLHFKSSFIFSNMKPNIVWRCTKLWSIMKYWNFWSVSLRR